MNGVIVRESNGDAQIKNPNPLPKGEGAAKRRGERIKTALNNRSLALPECAAQAMIAIISPIPTTRT